MTSDPARAQPGLLVIQRLHRMVRHGWRPWLGYDVASLQDQAIELRDKRSVAKLLPDGAVTFTDSNTIVAEDQAAFDARFPPNTRNKRNLMRRLYEIGL